MSAVYGTKRGFCPNHGAALVKQEIDTYDTDTGERNFYWVCPKCRAHGHNIGAILFCTMCVVGLIAIAVGQ